MCTGKNSSPRRKKINEIDHLSAAIAHKGNANGSANKHLLTVNSSASGSCIAAERIVIWSFERANVAIKLPKSNNKARFMIVTGRNEN